MKRVILMIAIIFTAVFAFTQEVTPVVEQSTNWWANLDYGSLLTIGLGIIATVFASGWAFATKKVRQAGTILIQFADAVEDKKIDANEKKGLALAARELFSK